MKRKIMLVAICTLVLLATPMVPAQAVPPDPWHYEDVWGPDFLTDCSEYADDYSFEIEWITVVTIDGRDFYNPDGSFKWSKLHVYGERIFYNSESGKQVSGNFSFIEKWDEGDTWFEAIHHGLEIRINVPGSGVVFLQTGTIDYYVTWNGDDVETITFSAGPKDWIDEEYEMLCAALAD